MSRGKLGALEHIVAGKMRAWRKNPVKGVLLNPMPEAC